MSESSVAVMDEVARALAALDLEGTRKTYWDQNEFIFLERWLPAVLVERMVAEVQQVRPAVHRNYIPKHKKGGSVSYYTLREQAPTIIALYRAPAFIKFLSAVTGQPHPWGRVRVALMQTQETTLQSPHEEVVSGREQRSVFRLTTGSDG